MCTTARTRCLKHDTWAQDSPGSADWLPGSAGPSQASRFVDTPSRFWDGPQSAWKGACWVSGVAYSVQFRTSMRTSQALFPLLGLLAVACINLPGIEEPPPSVPDGGTPMDGGSDGGPQPGPPDGGVDQTAPAVIRTSPPNGATRVPLDSTVEVDFSEEMSASTLRVTSVPAAGFTLQSWTPELRRAVFRAAASLEQDRQYTLSVEGKDLAGNALLTAYLFSFTTLGPTPDTTRPTLVGFSPASNSTGNPRNVNLKLTFSEPMNKASVEQAFSSSQNFVGTPSWNATGTEISFAPATTLSHGALVNWSLDPSATDLAGNTAAMNYSGLFRVIQLVVYSIPKSPVTLLAGSRPPTQQNPWHIGDDSDNFTYHGFVTFFLSDLINNTGCNTQSAVQSAALGWSYSDPGISPFASLGKLLVDPVNYGSNTDNNTLYTTPSIGTPLALSSQELNVQSGKTNIPVTAMVLARWSGQAVQFRLKFESTTDNDNVADVLEVDRDTFILNVSCEHP